MDWARAPKTVWTSPWAATPIPLLFGGAGPPIAGYVRDTVGSYEPVWYVAIGLMVLGALAVGTTPPPRRPTLSER